MRATKAPVAGSLLQEGGGAGGPALIAVSEDAVGAWDVAIDGHIIMQSKPQSG